MSSDPDWRARIAAEHAAARAAEREQLAGVGDAVLAMRDDAGKEMDRWANSLSLEERAALRVKLGRFRWEPEEA